MNRRNLRSNTRPSFTARHRRQIAVGFSLLEVILSIAILGGCVAVLGELVRIGVRSSRGARDLTIAQLVCESIIAEVEAGIRTTDADEGVIDYFDGSQWNYSIAVQQIDQEGLLEVTVRIQQDVTVAMDPVSFSLTRWMIDPELIAEIQAMEEEMAAQQAGETSGESDAGSANESGESPASGDSGGGR